MLVVQRIAVEFFEQVEGNLRFVFQQGVCRSPRGCCKRRRPKPRGRSS
jgi:hypothetical protein